MRRVLCVAGLIALAGVCYAADWTQFRGPQGLGVAADKGLPVKWSETENIVWKTDLPGAGSSSPIFVGDRIYLTTYSGYNVPNQDAGEMSDLKRHLVCLDRKTGDVKWTKDVPSELPEQDRIRDGHGYASSTLACDGKHLFAFFGKSGVFCFDLEGQPIWQKSVGTELSGWGSANSPVLFEDLVIINASVESQQLVALDKRTGKERWTAGGLLESWNTPLLVKNAKGQTEVAVSVPGKILSFNPKTGAPLWTCNTDINMYMVPSLVAEKDIIYCIGGKTNGMLAIRTGGKGDVTKSHRLWTGTKGSNVSSPVYHDKHLYFAKDNEAIVYCADAATGNIVYEERLPGRGGAQFYASPVLADGKLYYLSRDGKTFVIAAKPKFELLSTNQVGNWRDVCNASPVVADGRLFIRSDNYLYCIDE